MITLTNEQAQQIEEALDKLNSVYGLHETPCVAKALSTIRAARAQEQAEQEPVAIVRKNAFNNYVPMYIDESKGLPEGTKLYAAPVRTKDLTDDEIYPLYNEPTSDKEAIEFARAVIQEYRRKNGIV